MQVTPSMGQRRLENNRIALFKWIWRTVDNEFKRALKDQRDRIEIPADAWETLVELAVAEGDDVEPGQIIGRQDDRRATTRLAQAEAAAEGPDAGDLAEAAAPKAPSPPVAPPRPRRAPLQPAPPAPRLRPARWLSAAARARNSKVLSKPASDRYWVTPSQMKKVLAKAG